MSNTSVQFLRKPIDSPELKPHLLELKRKQMTLPGLVNKFRKLF
jgi:hypothetical protein